LKKHTILSGSKASYIISSSINFPPYLLLLLKTFLENRSYSVHLNFSVSTPIFLQAGLPQGAVLSTTLFSLYIADLPTSPNTLLALYADDTAVLTQSWRPDTIHRRLTHASTLLLKYFSRWKLQVNTHKTEIILFTRRRPMTPPPFRCQQAVIPRAPQVKYLGVLLDSKLLFSNHIKTTSQKALGVLCKLFPLLARDSTLPVTTKLALYKLTIRSILTYAAPVWSSTAPSNLKHLQITQSKCLRVIGNLPKRTPIQQLLALLQVQPLNEYIYNLTASFFNKCYSHPSPLIRTIGNYTLTDLLHLYPKYIHKWPKHLLLQQSIFPPPKPTPTSPAPRPTHLSYFQLSLDVTVPQSPHVTSMEQCFFIAFRFIFTDYLFVLSDPKGNCRDKRFEPPLTRLRERLVRNEHASLG